MQSTAFNLSENLGRLLGNQVFVELLRRGYIPGQTLFYYRTRNDKEIDFVTRKGSKVEKTRKRELDALVEAAEEFHCDNLLVITNIQQEETKWKNRKIKVISKIVNFTREASGLCHFEKIDI